MRLISLLFTATLIASPAAAQQRTASSLQDPQPAAATQPPASGDRQPAAAGQPSTTDGQPPAGSQFDFPVSLDKIKGALEQQAPSTTLRMTDNRPTFRIQILERQKIEELLATLNYKAGPTPAGGVYWNEVQRQMWPAVDNPLRQPYSAFNQGELLTILIENLVGRYLVDKGAGALKGAARAHAESTAREEVRQAIRDYCAAQPNGGAGIQICTSSDSVR
jgi:hypothetical protein